MNGGSVVVNGYERAVSVLGSFTMAGSIIEGKGSSYSLVCVFEDKTFTMTGGSIVCAEGSNVTHGVLLDYSTMIVSGNVTIGPEVYVQSINSHVWGGDDTHGLIYVSDALTGGQPIPVRMEKRSYNGALTQGGVFVRGNSGHTLQEAEVLTGFTSVDPAYGIRFTNSQGELYLRTTYNVSFAPGEGTGKMDAAVAYEGVPFVLPACGFTAPEGMRFKEWSVRIGDADPVSMRPDDEITVTANTTVTAVWTSAPSFKTHSLALSGRIGVNFFLELPEIEGVDYGGSYMTFDITGKGMVTKKDKFDPNDKDTNTGKYYGFTCYINSVQMADTITATFHYGDGLTVEETYSVKAYLEKFDEILEENPNAFEEETVALLKALGDYGHYVQPFLAEANHWSIGTDYAEMDQYYTTYTENDIDLVTEKTGPYAVERTASDDIEKITYSLALDSSTEISVFFRPANGFSGEVTFKVGEESATAVKTEDGRYRIRIRNIKAYDLGTSYTVTAETVNGTAAITVSALSYVQSLLTAEAYQDNAAARNAMAALYGYYTAAKAYTDTHQ